MDSKPLSYPMDGGRRAWATLFGAWLIVAATFGYTNAFGVYQDLYTREHAASASRISWIGSTQLFLLIAVGLPAGKLYDLGYFHHVVSAGSILYTFSLFMVSLAHPDKYYQLFLSQGIGMGIGAGLVYTPTLAIQTQHWRVHRSLAMGAVTTGVAAGGIFLPIMLNQLLHNSVGFAWAVRASAFVVFGMLLLGNCLITSYPRPAATDATADIGAILKDVPYMLFTLGGLFINWGLYFPYFYLQLYAILLGMDPNVAFYMLAILNGSSIPGRVLPPLLTNKLGALNVMTMAASGCAILLFALFGVKTIAGVVVFAIVYGFFAGGFFATLSPALTTFSTNERDFGIRLGLAFTATSIGALTGTPIDGRLLGETFPWWKPIVFSGVRHINYAFVAIH
ncbi:MFS general substrate transporter [Artomyces pyxidatus]|uniref:MFS general substrate transporter n=2 Tax=Artomyces pyxidatus TaxID=48021 RepID=A0ACB8SKC5_9AGAM|nr:MFS general substrate transporter [Artomyces pyxidatus]KAI0057024.1 MFS general substrate transporter [Artomyces pyxidatus]